MNPAIALGLMLCPFKFTYWIPYLIMPLAGGAGGLFFHELILRKTMDMLDDTGFQEIQKIYSSDGEENSVNGHVANAEGHVLKED